MMASKTARAISAYMAELGRRGGTKGGKRAAENMTEGERSARARSAANRRWQIERGRATLTPLHEIARGMIDAMNLDGVARALFYDGTKAWHWPVGSAEAIASEGAFPDALIGTYGRGARLTNVVADLMEK